MLKQKRQQGCWRYEFELKYYLLDKILWKTIFVKGKRGVISLHRSFFRIGFLGERSEGTMNRAPTRESGRVTIGVCRPGWRFGR